MQQGKLLFRDFWIQTVASSRSDQENNSSKVSLNLERRSQFYPLLSCAAEAFWDPGCALWFHILLVF